MNELQRVNTTTDHGCFGCGERNPYGLRLQFYRAEGGVRAEFTPNLEHEGYAQLTHGGIVSTLLDEAMSWAVIDAGRLAVTAKMEVRFKQPVPIGTPLVVFGRVERDRGRLVEATGELRDGDGAVLASSSGVFAWVSDAQQEEWEARYLTGAS